MTPPDCDVAIGEDRTRSLYDSHGLDRPRMGNEVLRMNQQEIQNLHFLFSCYMHVKELL